MITSGQLFNELHHRDLLIFSTTHGVLSSKLSVLIQLRSRHAKLSRKEECKYATICKGGLAEYQLVSKPFCASVDSSTASDSLCQVTRSNLGLLSKKTTNKLVYLNKKQESRKKTRDIQLRFNLLKNLGRVNRGTKVTRLYSPWVGASSQVSKRFQLDGWDITSIDLQAAQPTLMAAMAGDAKLLADCKSDALYQGIASHLKIDRDNAKKAFMAYAYGKIRGNWHGHRDVYQVQELMKKHYPKAAGFVMKEKRDKGYKQ